MTVSTTTARKVYSGDGSTTAFPTTFPFFDDTDLTVTLVNQTTGAESVQTLGASNDYIVEGGDGSTGDVIFSTAPASDEDVVIQRELPYTQEVDYLANDAFPAETHEEALDRLVMLAQQLKSKTERAILLAVNTSLSDVRIPEPGALKLLRWNAAGDNLEAVDLADVDTDLDAVFTGLANDDLIQRKSGEWKNRTPSQVGQDVLEGISSSPANDDFVQRKSGVWVNRTAAQAAADIEPHITTKLASMSVSSNTDLSNSDMQKVVFASASGGNFTITLPDKSTLSTDDEVVIVGEVVTEGNKVVIVKHANDGGGEIYTLYAPGDYVRLKYDGSDWVVIDHVSTGYAELLKTSDQSVPASTANKITFQTANNARGITADTTNNKFTTLHAGWYDINMYAQFSNGNATVQTYIGGAKQHDFGVGFGVNLRSVHQSITKYIDANKDVEMYSFNNAGSPQNVMGDASVRETQMDITLIRREV